MVLERWTKERFFDFLESNGFQMVWKSARNSGFAFYHPAFDESDTLTFTVDSRDNTVRSSIIQQANDLIEQIRRMR